MIDFEKKLMEEQINLNDTIRRIALMRNRDYLVLKERVEAEEMLDELRRNELLNANKVIEVQEVLIDYSSKELYDAKKIIDATENVAELSRVEALELHNELIRLREEKRELELKIKSLVDENMELKKRY
jgi:predicted MPP superfamily phosphohydrolase